MTATRTILLSALIALALSLVPVAAQDVPERAGYFDVRSATTNLVDGVHELEARLQLVLSAQGAVTATGVRTQLGRIARHVTGQAAAEAPLIIRVRRFIYDEVEAELTLQYELEYRPLSQRYIVRNVRSGDQDSFATLYSALNNLGRIQALPLIDDSLLSSSASYRIRLRALLSTTQYPAPLRILFFWRSEWQLKSDWYEWRLER